MLPLITMLFIGVPTAAAPAPEAAAVTPAVLSEDAEAPAPEAEEAESKWTGSVSAGAIWTDGNLDSLSATVTGDAELRRERDRFTLGLFWNYQEDEDDTTGDTEISQRRTGGSFQYDYFFTEKTYGLAQTSLEGDYSADLQLRTTAGLGLGRQFIEDEVWKVSAEAGINYFVEDFYHLSPDKYAAARLASNVDWMPSETWELGTSAELYPSLEDSNDVYGKLDTRAKLTLSEAMFAQFQWIMDWDNTPPSGNDRIDNRFLMTLGWGF